MREIRLLGLDWGTSALRAYACDGQGEVLDSRHAAHGLMHLPPGGFAQALEDLCGDWLAAWPDAPVLACGMVGSAQGWAEVPYAELDGGEAALASGLRTVSGPGGRPVHLVPGLIQRGALPEVMRGEETQVLGVLQTLGAGDAALLIGLPGTHSKWVWVQHGVPQRFCSFMTGEIFAALRGHTVLGRTLPAAGEAEAFDAGAFERGLAVARQPAGRLGLLSNAFSMRSLFLTGALARHAQSDYLSGLLVGHELAGLRAGFLPADAAPPRLVLCGSDALCERYALALRQMGLGHAEQLPQATAAGLWRLACRAGLVRP